MKKIIIYSFFFFFLFYAQTSIQIWSPAYEFFCIFDVRKYIGLATLEMIFWSYIFILIGIHILYNEINLKKDYKYLFKLLLNLILISVTSMLILSDDKPLAIRTIYYYLRPLLVVSVIGIFEYSEKEIKFYLKKFSWIFFIILLLSYFQMIVLGYQGDSLSSIMDNSHTFAFLMYNGILFFLTRYFITKKISNIFYAVIILIPTLVASADKFTIMFVITIIVILISYYKIKIKTIFKFSGYALVTLFLLFNIYFLLSDDIRFTLLGGLVRFEPLLEIENIPILLSRVRLFEGYLHIPIFLLKYPYIFLIGAGPGMYGSTEVLGQFFSLEGTKSFGSLSSSELKNFAFGGDLFFTNYSIFGTTGTSFASSDIIVIILEFGILFLILYFLFFKNIWKKTECYKNIEFSETIKIVALYSRAYLIFILLVSFITFQDGLVRASNIYPYFILLTMLSKFNQKSKK